MFEGTSQGWWASKAEIDGGIMASQPIVYLEYRRHRSEISGKANLKAAAFGDMPGNLGSFFAVVGLQS